MTLQRPINIAGNQSAAEYKCVVPADGNMAAYNRSPETIGWFGPIGSSYKLYDGAVESTGSGAPSYAGRSAWCNFMSSLAARR